MDNKLFNALIDKAEQIDPQNEVLYEENQQKRFDVLANDLTDTIVYLDNCSKRELDWASESFERLAEHFQSVALLECVKRNIYRFADPILNEQLKKEYENMQKISDK